MKDQLPIVKHLLQIENSKFKKASAIHTLFQTRICLLSKLRNESAIQYKLWALVAWSTQGEHQKNQFATIFVNRDYWF